MNYQLGMVYRKATVHMTNVSFVNWRHPKNVGSKFPKNVLLNDIFIRWYCNKENIETYERNKKVKSTGRGVLCSV